MNPRKQCAKCPWKTSTNPREIPDGYCAKKHARLLGTIAEPGVIRVGQPLRVMACHETHSKPCVGWLYNQLGEGNNIGLRIAVSAGQIDANTQIVGPQHARFKDTLPGR